MGELEKNATPDGNDNTPAPMILLAKLKVDTAIVASPPLLTDDALASMAMKDRLLVEDGNLDTYCDLNPTAIWLEQASTTTTASNFMLVNQMMVYTQIYQVLSQVQQFHHRSPPPTRRSFATRQ